MFSCKILFAIMLCVPVTVYSMEKSEFRKNKHTLANQSGPIEDEIATIEKKTGSDFEFYSTYLKNGDHLMATRSSNGCVRVMLFSHEFKDMREEESWLFWVLKRLFEQSE